MGSKTRALAWLPLVAALTLAAAACGDDGVTGSSDGGSGNTDNADIKIGMVYDITGKGDGSFNDSAYAGLLRAQEELGVQIKDIEPSSAGAGLRSCPWARVMPGS